MGKLQFRGGPPSRIKLNGLSVPRAYLGTELVWQAGTLEGPKIDPAHSLANRATMHRLTNGALEGMTAVSNYAVVDNAFASAIAGTQAFLREPLPATSPTTLRVSATIRVDKTAGRYSRVGWASNTATPTTASPDIWVGHTAGSGIQIGSMNFAISLAQNVLAESKLVDGAWYRVTVVWDKVLTASVSTGNDGPNRVYGSAEPVDTINNPAVPWTVSGGTAKHAPSYVPMAVVARTNSPLGTIKDLFYVDSMFGINEDNAPIQYNATETSGSGSDLFWVYSKAKAAPLRIIVTAGGSGLYGGGDWAASGRTGQPYDQWRQTWRDLADLGYTVLHTNALHEGWGADDHLAKQIWAIDRLKNEFGTDARIYYMGYSMGGLSAWRAIMGRANYPAIRAAYIIAGAVELERYYDVTAYYQIKTRWPDPLLLDSPKNFPAEDLLARGTRVRLVTSTGDTNVVKSETHDLMQAKYGSSELYSELVHDGIGHFDPAYWSVPDMVSFFEGQDLA